MTTTTASVSAESPSRPYSKAYLALGVAVSTATYALILTEQWSQFGMYFVFALYLVTVAPARRTIPTSGSALVGSMGAAAVTLVICSGGFTIFGFGFALPDHISAVTGGFMLTSALAGWAVLHLLRRTIQDPWMDTLSTKIVIGSAAASGVFLSAGVLTFMIVLLVAVAISAFIANRDKTPNPNLVLVAGTLINAAAILTAFALMA